MDKLERAFGEWIIRYRIWVILACVIMVILAIPFGKAPNLTTNYRVFFSKENPELRAFENLERTYSKQDNILFVITPKNGNVYTKETLRAVGELSNELRGKKGYIWKLPGIKQTSSLLYAQYSANGKNTLLVKDDYRKLKPESFQSIRSAAMKNYSSLKQYINSDATSATIPMHFSLPGNDRKAEVRQLKKDIAILLDQIHLKFPELKAQVDLSQLEKADIRNFKLVLTLQNQEKSSIINKTAFAAMDFLTNELQIAKGLAWSLPFSKRVDAINTYRHTIANGNDLNTEILVEDPNKLKPEDLARIRKIVEAEPTLMGRVVNESGTVTAVNVVVHIPGIDPQNEVPDTVREARRVARYIEQKYPHVKVRLTGMVMFSNAFPEASINDVKTLYPLALLFITVFLFLLTRSFASVLLTLSVILLSIISAMGIAIHIGIPLTPPSMSAPIVILTVAVASSVHILVSFVHQMRHEAMDKHAAIKESLRINLVPVFVTSLTTAIGFMTLNFSDVPPFRHLGSIVAMGVGVSFILSVFFVPAILSLLPILIKQRKLQNKTIMYRFGDWVVQQRRALFWSMLVLILLLIALIPRNSLNEVFLHYFDKSIQVRQDMDYAIKHLSGQYILEYSVEAPKKKTVCPDKSKNGGSGSGQITDPHYLKDVDKFITWLRSEENKKYVRHVFSFMDNIKRINRTMNDDKQDKHVCADKKKAAKGDCYYRVPDNSDVTSEYLMSFYPMTIPYGMDERDQIETINYSAMRVTLALNTVSTVEMVKFENKIQEWLKNNTQHIGSARGSGPTMMFTRISRRNAKSMLIGTTVALVLISFILIIAFRSVKMGMISMIPNLVPAAMGFGVWALLDGEIGLGLSIVTGMTLGIIVDDTIHFLSKYLRAKRENNYNAADSVRYAFHTVGYALVTTSIVLIAGFLIMSMSLFKMNSDMGILTSIVIGLALLADFLFLPPLLMKLEGKSNA
jgi:predicted RND superfamily exporter protein